MSCVKTAEPIEMQFGMLSWVGPRWVVPTRRGTFKRDWLIEVKSIIKHRILGVG